MSSPTFSAADAVARADQVVAQEGAGDEEWAQLTRASTHIYASDDPA
jgi:hypothetical protein